MRASQLVDIAHKLYVQQGRHNQINADSVASNMGNLHNPTTRNQGNEATVTGQRRNRVMRLYEMMLVVMCPEHYLKKMSALGDVDSNPTGLSRWAVEHVHGEPFSRVSVAEHVPATPNACCHAVFSAPPAAGRGPVRRRQQHCAQRCYV